MIVEALAKVVDGHDLTVAEATAVMADMMEDRASPAQFGAFVTALRLKGETSAELAGMAQVMREKAVRVTSDRQDELVDTCGTGGDASGSFNVSTASAFVVAAAGVPVAKHGNRGMTSKCGSADVLEALGVSISLGPDAVARCIDQAGMAFMFAPAYHPAMKFAAPLRRELGIRTIFNILGPLTNPAGATRQVIGVASPTVMPVIAGALIILGAARTLVVHGDGNLDEISISGATVVHDVDGPSSSTYSIHPSDHDIATAPRSAIAGGTAPENAQLITELFSTPAVDHASRARHDIVCLNAGAALVASGRVTSLANGVARARELIASGAARHRLETLIRVSQALA